MAFSLKKLLVVCFLTLGGALLLSTPLLLRFSVYSEETLPLGFQDVLPLRWRVSTFWCQNQTALSTHTFNAYLYDGAQASVTEHSVQVQCWRAPPRGWPSETAGLRFPMNQTKCYNACSCSREPTNPDVPPNTISIVRNAL